MRRVTVTRGTTQIAAKAATSRSNKRYPLTRANGNALENLQRFGSEVMGLVAESCRFAPNTDSLKVSLPDRLRHSLFLYCGYYTMSTGKSQMFSAQRLKKNRSCFCAKSQSIEKSNLFVDKSGDMWLNKHNRNKKKTLTENLPLLKAPESRRLV